MQKGLQNNCLLMLSLHYITDIWTLKNWVYTVLIFYSALENYFALFASTKIRDHETLFAQTEAKSKAPREQQAKDDITYCFLSTALPYGMRERLRFRCCCHAMLFEENARKTCNLSTWKLSVPPKCLWHIYNLWIRLSRLLGYTLRYHIRRNKRWSISACLLRKQAWTRSLDNLRRNLCCIRPHRTPRKLTH